MMLEVIATTVDEALEIEAGGASRIELVAALSEGGLTPSFGLIEAVIKQVKIPVNVMIRPHSKNFIYTNDEIELMKQDIKMVSDLGANGVVFGVLTKDNEVDFKKLESLLEVCGLLEVTFHRAIDETDVVYSTRALSKYGEITTILTSGGLAAPIEQNVDLIKEMMLEAKHINILLGGGITFNNLNALLEQTGATHFHVGTAVRTDDDIDREKVVQLKLKGGV